MGASWLGTIAESGPSILKAIHLKQAGYWSLVKLRRTRYGAGTSWVLNGSGCQRSGGMKRRDALCTVRNEQWQIASIGREVEGIKMPHFRRRNKAHEPLCDQLCTDCPDRPQVSVRNIMQ